MAAVYTDITIDDLDKYLKRAFRALRPKQTVCKGEYCYLLSLSPNVRIQIFTAITRGATSSRDVGTDTIKLQLVGDTTNRPLLAGKGSSLSMKRTQGWKTTLQDRIEDLVELYEERKDYWESRAGNAPKEEEREEVPPESVAPSENDEPKYDPSRALNGTFTRGNSGEWAAKIDGAGAPGAKAILVTKGMRKVPVILKDRKWTGVDHYTRNYSEIWTIEDKTRSASEVTSTAKPEASYDTDVGFESYDYRG